MFCLLSKGFSLCTGKLVSLEQTWPFPVTPCMTYDLSIARRRRLADALAEARLRVLEREEQARHMHAQFLDARAALSEAQALLAQTQRLYDELSLVSCATAISPRLSDCDRRLPASPCSTTPTGCANGTGKKCPIRSGLSRTLLKPKPP